MQVDGGTQAAAVGGVVRPVQHRLRQVEEEEGGVELQTLGRGAVVETPQAGDLDRARGARLAGVTLLQVQLGGGMGRRRMQARADGDQEPIQALTSGEEARLLLDRMLGQMLGRMLLGRVLATLVDGDPVILVRLHMCCTA